MSFMEKLNLAALAGGVLALGWYLVRVVPQIGQVPLDEIAWKWPMAIAMGIFIVLLVISAVRMAISDPAVRKADGIIDDERDRDIERRGDAWGGHAMHAVGFAALVMLVLDVHSFWIAQTLFVGGMLAGVVSIGVKLFAYRGEV